MYLLQILSASLILATAPAGEQKPACDQEQVIQGIMAFMAKTAGDGKQNGSNYNFIGPHDREEAEAAAKALAPDKKIPGETAEEKKTNREILARDFAAVYLRHSPDAACQSVNGTYGLDYLTPVYIEVYTDGKRRKREQEVRKQSVAFGIKGNRGVELKDYARDMNPDGESVKTALDEVQAAADLVVAGGPLPDAMDMPATRFRLSRLVRAIREKQPGENIAERRTETAVAFILESRDARWGMDRPAPDIKKINELISKQFGPRKRELVKALNHIANARQKDRRQLVYTFSAMDDETALWLSQAWEARLAGQRGKMDYYAGNAILSAMAADPARFTLGLVEPQGQCREAALVRKTNRGEKRENVTRCYLSLGRKTSLSINTP